MATANKYDRQLRLWGTNGQKKLSESSILLIGSSSVGTETVKNLVLPGIGSFHVLDEASNMQPTYGSGHKDTSVTTTSDNRTSNFFIPTVNIAEEESAGSTSMLVDKSCAEVACELLEELNDDVKGSFATVPSFVDMTTGDFESLVNDYSLVVAADLPLPVLRNLGKACWSKNVHLISAKSYGFIGTCRIQTARHDIVESRPDGSVPDLRIWKPFPELVELCNKYDFSRMDDMEHSHVPYVIILMKAMEQWKSDNNDAMPTTFADKEKFKNESVKAMSRNFANEVNFEEAVRDAYLAYSAHDIPWEVQELLDNVSSESISSSSRSFDVMLLALKNFIADHGGDVPLNGTIPDMTSATDPYVALQEVYHKKAAKDLAEMRTNVDSVLTAVGSATSIVSDEKLSTFCKNIFNIQVLKTRNIEDELTCSGTDYEEVKGELIMSTMEPCDPPVHTPLLWFLVMRACEQFQEKHGVYPGSDCRELALSSDVEEVMKHLERLVSCMGLSECDVVTSSLSKDHAIEMVRCFNAELHNIASVIGGVASQEAVKLITNQYVPFDNTYVFNGIASIAAVYKF